MSSFFQTALDTWLNRGTMRMVCWLLFSFRLPSISLSDWANCWTVRRVWTWESSQ